LDEFREHLGGQLTLMLLTGIGRSKEVHQVDIDRYRQAFDWLAAATVERIAACT
jgi:3-dehydroquinate synthase